MNNGNCLFEAPSRLAFGFADFAPPFIDWAFLWMARIVVGDDPENVFIHHSSHESQWFVAHT